jgi:transposase
VLRLDKAPRSRHLSHTPRGAHASSALYSLIETAKANGLEHHQYLFAVISRLPAAQTEEAISALPPWHLRETLSAWVDRR